MPNRPQEEKERDMSELSEQIKDKAEVISNLLKDGKHVELCENKDGLRIISMDRKVVKWLGGYQIKINYRDGESEERFVDDWGIKGGCLYTYVRFGVNSGTRYIPLDQIKEYTVK